jgi:hypothetical protein
MSHSIRSRMMAKSIRLASRLKGVGKLANIPPILFMANSWPHVCPVSPSGATPVNLRSPLPRDFELKRPPSRAELVTVENYNRAQTDVYFAGVVILGDGNSSWNSASDAEPSDTGPGATAQSAVAGALRAGRKTYPRSSSGGSRPSIRSKPTALGDLARCRNQDFRQN